MKNNILTAFFLFCCWLGLSGCSSDELEAPIPIVPVYEEINLQDIRYQNLHIGGWIYLEGGVRGLVLIKQSEFHYIALDRACTYHPEDPCAVVEMHSSGLYLLDNCCGSQFEKTGGVIKGPAQRPLLQYNTYINGNYLTIQN